MTTPQISNFTDQQYAFDGSILVEQYDLMYYTGDDVKPASSQADAGSQSANQRVFAPKFAGLSRDHRNATDGAVAKFPVIDSGIATMDCDSNTWEVGDMVAAIEASSGTALEDQKVTKTTDQSAAIGRCAVRETSASTRVVFYFQSNITKQQFAQAGYIDAAQQALSGAGALTVTEFYSAWTTTAANAGTLANGLFVGQLKKIQLIVDGGDGTLTPTSLTGGTTITFADAGDYALLRWNGSAWTALELGNDADGATAPVLA